MSERFCRFLNRRKPESDEAKDTFSYNFKQKKFRDLIECIIISFKSKFQSIQKERFEFVQKEIQNLLAFRNNIRIIYPTSNGLLN